MLERVDFTAEDLDAGLERAALEQVAHSGFALGALARDGTEGLPLLVAGLRATIETPLGPLFGSTRLADLAPTDRLDELGFDLRLGEAGRHPTVRDIGRVVGRFLPSDHVLAPWAAALAAGAIDVRLAGYLTGSIDLVARVGDGPGGPGFVVADYKTNRLTPRGGHTDRRRLRRGADDGRHGRAPLSAPGPALRRRPPSLPAVAAAGGRPARHRARRRLPVRPGHDRSRRASSRTPPPRGVHLGVRPGHARHG